MTQKDNGGPAFPGLLSGKFGTPIQAHEGMTLREYAAIHLQQPDSGIDWLDAMILSAKRDAIAGQALPQAVEDYDRKTRGVMDTKMNVLPWAAKATGTREEIIVRQAYRYADAMLAERSK